jgi:hypothetical protein
VAAKIHTYLQRIKLTPKSIPIALLAANVLAFGLLIPFLGYYQDDWHFVYYAYTRGAQGLWELFNYDGHPFSAWSYVIGFKFLGFKPLYWHLFSLTWRWLACVAFWLCIHELWPRRVRETLAAALIFAIYPLFSLQSQAISYIEMWMSYCLLNLSFYLMIRAIRHPERFAAYTAAAFALKLIHLFTTEYFAGLELVRPLLIYLALKNTKRAEGRSFAWKTIGVWSPYLFVSGIFTVWRTFFYLSPFAKQNAPVLIQNLIASPFSTLQYLILSAIPDVVLILTTPWANIVSAQLFDFSTRTSFLFFILAVLSGVAFFLLLNRPGWNGKGAKPEKQSQWTGEALILGFASMILGMLPAYAANYFIHTENQPWGSRFSVAAMFGAALIAATALNALATNARTRNVVLAAMLGLSVGWHLNNANSFRLVWEKEMKFYQQLAWRAPSIQPNTAIITDQEILAYMGDYPMGFAINSIYAQPHVSTGKTVPYWYFSLENNFGNQIEGFLRGMPISQKKFSVRFTGNSTQNLILTFAPEQGQCLWLLRPEEVGAPFLSPHLQQAAALSATERIEADSKHPLLYTLSGANPHKTWCYYYEKAELARDQKDWEAVAQSWESAKQQGLRPGSDIEYLPFIEAYAHLGDWKTAAAIEKDINLNQRVIRPSLCFLWNKIEQETSASPERDSLIKQSRTESNCGD